MTENNVAQIEPVEDKLAVNEKSPEAEIKRLSISTMSFVEVCAAIRSNYNIKGVIELDSEAPLSHGAVVSFKSKDTGFMLARARAHLLSTPSYDKATGNLFLYLQFIEVSLGPGRTWNIGVNGPQ